MIPIDCWVGYGNSSERETLDFLNGDRKMKNFAYREFNNKKKRLSKTEPFFCYLLKYSALNTILNKNSFALSSEKAVVLISSIN